MHSHATFSFRSISFTHLQTNHSFLIPFWNWIFECCSVCSSIKCCHRTQHTHTHKRMPKIRKTSRKKDCHPFRLLSLASMALGNARNWLSRAFHIDSRIYTFKLHGLIFILLDIIIYASPRMKWICLKINGEWNEKRTHFSHSFKPCECEQYALQTKGQINWRCSHSTMKMYVVCLLFDIKVMKGSFGCFSF